MLTIKTKNSKWHQNFNKVVPFVIHIIQCTGVNKIINRNGYPVIQEMFSSHALLLFMMLFNYTMWSIFSSTTCTFPYAFLFNYVANWF